MDYDNELTLEQNYLAMEATLNDERKEYESSHPDIDSE